MCWPTVPNLPAAPIVAEQAMPKPTALPPENAFAVMHPATRSTRHPSASWLRVYDVNAPFRSNLNAEMTTIQILTSASSRAM